MGTIKDLIEYLLKIFRWWVSVLPWERGLRIRLGKKVKLLNPGFHFRFPFFDTVHIQTIRLRVVTIPPQTITTKDGQTLTVTLVVGYSIKDIEKVFNTIHHPEATICNLVSGEVSDFVSQNNTCSPKIIQEEVLKKISKLDYGLNIEYIKVTGYAIVKTFRLIQDQHWTPNNLDLTELK